MFKEIMNVVADLFKNEHYCYDKLDIKQIATYLHLRWEEPSESIINFKMIKCKKVPDIALVTLQSDTNKRIADYTIFDGNVTKIIGVNLTVMERNEESRIATLLTLFGDINNTFIENYNPLFSSCAVTSLSLTDILGYAPFIMTIAYIQSFLPFIEDDVIAKIAKLMYPNVTLDSVTSARKLVTDFTITELLDNGIWYGVTDEEYPDIRFNDKKPEYSDNWKDEEWQPLDDEGENDETDNN